MVGAIILTAERNHNAKVINIVKPSPSFRDENDFSLKNLEIIKPKHSNMLAPFIILNEFLFYFIFSNFYTHNNNIYQKLHIYVSLINVFFHLPLLFSFIIIKFIKQFNLVEGIHILFNFICNLKVRLHLLRWSGIGIYPFFDILNNENYYSEGITGTLMYYVISNVLIGLLLLFINSSFSLSVKYLEKGGGFECGFTSFVQTRERYNIIFYRVSLLFLIFDLEIILAFPYPALYQKNQNISKNNLLAFLYILVVGFIYELKEGALNIVKTPHQTDINVK
jgi:NADH:ubiquinone oxidoreductase subunit 3 (subunit A)